MMPETPERGVETRFPERLRALVDERGWSHRRLAKELGVSKQSVTNWTQGNTEPSLRHLRGLARVLDVPSEVLLNDGGPTPDARASELLRELAEHPARSALRSLGEATPSLLDLLERAERHVRSSAGPGSRE